MEVRELLESAKGMKTNPSDDEEWDPSVVLQLRSRKPKNHLREREKRKKRKRKCLVLK